MLDNTVIVFDKDGTPERHTRPNARDLVNAGLRYWHKGRATTPAAIAPFAVFKAPEGSKSQEVLNRATGQSSDGKSGAAAAAESALQRQLDEQAAALAAEQAAALLEATAAAGVVDFTAPVQVDTTDDAALDAEVEAAADAAVEAQTPTTRRRRNS